MANPGTDAHGVIRQDFPGNDPGLSAAQRDALEYTRKLLNWRRTASALHEGALTQYAPQDDVYVYFRHDNRQKVMVAFNKAEAERSIETSRFVESIGASRRARDVLSGRDFAVESTLALPPRSVTVLELAGETPLPAGVTGTVKTEESFPSKRVAARRVDVWLPPGYEANSTRRYPVLYMHDGQNLFDPALSYIGVDWGIDETMTRLIREGAVREAIVVGVWNTPKRSEEYLPAKAVTGSKKPDDWPDMFWLRKLTNVSDDYLRFLVGELKPFVDSNYRTLPNRANTFTMGSSAGALISIYALAEYPDVFGGAGGVSTHWPMGDGLMIDYLEPRLAGLRGGHRFYFDFGTETLDSNYEPYQRRVDALMRRAGYVEGVDWMTRKYEGDEHSERAWRRRVDVPLRFLLGR
jgi:predicted alpha/beta superfamily hydrolase